MCVVLCVVFEIIPEVTKVWVRRVASVAGTPSSVTTSMGISLCLRSMSVCGWDGWDEMMRGRR